MLKVWGRRNSSNVQKVLWFCDEAALRFKHEEIGGEFGRTTECRHAGAQSQCPRSHR
ncbi:MAG: hypothetical protein V1267_05965 [Alphaproteobacteria bacterium]|nr:hypothetical protein [Alphaproteobacteria bacterium]